jgi:hypothetical protein
LVVYKDTAVKHVYVLCGVYILGYVQIFL